MMGVTSYYFHWKKNQTFLRKKPHKRLKKVTGIWYAMRCCPLVISKLQNGGVGFLGRCWKQVRNIWIQIEFGLLLSSLLCILSEQHVCACARFVSPPLLVLSKVCRTRSLRSECKLDQVDFRDWMLFLAFTLMEEIIPTQKSQKRKCLRSWLVESSVNTDHTHR